ncbi:glycosyl transferase family 90 [Reichenbachiella ulvae]|uniref:Glycosyl transferase family 90 n=1 Tax=Reichenbachiella ulvae TaxID=2980104 RepID=A0ABT3CTA1_9BACT|nr:glycosyl transferase family 90 [Reichenbachiella ulvae]MCV9386827.1 glycosyl transferase family 90 [Reichenbachiella ulvae]
MSKNDIEKEFWFSPQERVDFYLNGLDSFEIDLEVFKKIKNSNEWNQKELHLVSFEQYENTFTHWYCKYIVHLPRIRNIRVLPYYKAYKDLHSLMNFFIPFDKLGLKYKAFKYPLFYGETGYTDGIPCLKKSRRGDDEESVIFNFRTLRLTQPCESAQKNDIPWRDKKNSVIWRGATTGQEQRVTFVEKYFNKYDVAFATTKQKPHLAHLKKAKVSIKKQLEYKFVISLEGNDVASNLRWVLSSNSVPIMPKPYWQSWIMEEKLEPFVHYLELNKDLSNLEEVLKWASENDEKCEQIAENGKKYMAQFLDDKNDIQVQKLLLEEYAKRVSYKNSIK